MSTPVLFSSRIACRSERNGKYLRSVYDKHESGIRIDASAEHVVGSARTRFFVDKFEEERRLVHIRCSYNKYWVPQEVKDGGRTYWVIGTAHEPDEDLSSPSCTLFEYTHVSDKSFRFHHPGLRKNACIADETKPYLQLKDDASDTFTVVGLSQHKELPKYIVVKGDNGLYLRTKTYSRLKYPPDPFFPSPIVRPNDFISFDYLQFGGKDKGHPDVLHTTSTNDEGLVRIETFKNNRIWRFHQEDFVRVDSNVPSDDPYALFKVVSAGDGFTALLNVGSKLFCKRKSGRGTDPVKTSSWKEDCLSAEVHWIGPAEKLTVEEPVRDRNISDDVNFHVHEARIHDMGSIPGDEQPHHNPHDSAEPVEISFERKMSMESKCVSSISQQTIEELKSNFSVGLEIPLSKMGNLKVDGGDSKYKYSEHITVKDLEEFKTGSNAVNHKHTIYVPPKTLWTVKFVTRQVHYDIPFSYKETAVLLMNGEELEPVFHDDGLNTIILRYTSYDIEEKPLK